MIRPRWLGQREVDADQPASAAEFVRLFESENADLRWLAVLLTANAKDAEHCLALALKECISNNPVSKDWAHAWARRVVIRTAVRIVTDSKKPLAVPTRDYMAFPIPLRPTQAAGEVITEPTAILDLPEFERLAFVLCVLERCSVYDCALLVGRSPRAVYEAKERATSRVIHVSEDLPHQDIVLTDQWFPYLPTTNTEVHK